MVSNGFKWFSIVEKILNEDDYIPFVGSEAEEIYSEVLKQLPATLPNKEKLARRVVLTLHHITDEEVANSVVNMGFTCQKCGECCRRLSPIRFEKKDLKNISAYLNIPYKKLKKKIGAIPKEKGVFMVRGKPCYFLKDNLCTIYPYRPDVCVAFPAQELLAKVSGRSGFLPKWCPQTKINLVYIAVTRVYNEVIYHTPALQELLKPEIEKMIKDIGDTSNLKRIDYTLKLIEYFKQENNI